MTNYLKCFFIALILSVQTLHAQTVKDSLWTQLVLAQKDTAKLKILNKIHAYYQFQGSEATRNIDSAEHYVNEAYALALKMNVENKDVCNAIRAKASFIFQQKKDPVNAIQFYLTMISIAENIRDTFSIGQGYLAVGNIYTYQHLTEKALEYYQKSQFVNEKRQIARYTSISSNVLGYTYQSLSKMDSAEFYYKKAVNMSLATPEKYRLQSYLYNIIDFYQKQKNTTQAQYYLDFAFKNKDLPSENLDFIAKQLNFGKYYQSQKQYTQAVNYLTQVIDAKQKNSALAEDELVVECCSETSPRSWILWWIGVAEMSHYK